MKHFTNTLIGYMKKKKHHTTSHQRYHPHCKGLMLRGTRGGNQAFAVMFAMCVKRLYATPVIFLHEWFHPCSAPGFPLWLQSRFPLWSSLNQLLFCVLLSQQDCRVTSSCVYFCFLFLFFFSQRQSEMIRISILEYLFLL